MEWHLLKDGISFLLASGRIPFPGPFGHEVAEVRNQEAGQEATYNYFLWTGAEFESSIHQGCHLTGGPNLWHNWAAGISKNFPIDRCDQSSPVFEIFEGHGGRGRKNLAFFKWPLVFFFSWGWGEGGWFRGDHRIMFNRFSCENVWNFRIAYTPAIWKEEICKGQSRPSANRTWATGTPSFDGIFLKKLTLR